MFAVATELNIVRVKKFSKKLMVDLKTQVHHDLKQDVVTRTDVEVSIEKRLVIVINATFHKYNLSQRINTFLTLFKISTLLF